MATDVKQAVAQAVTHVNRYSNLINMIATEYYRQNNRSVKMQRALYNVAKQQGYPFGYYVFCDELRDFNNKGA